jgi:hypothetical protein
MRQRKARPSAKPKRNKTLQVAFATIAVYLFISLLGAAYAEDFAITVYGGRVTDADASHAISPSVDFVDAYLITGAVAWTFKRFLDDKLSLEVEGNVGKYFGDQENWEFNVAVAGRWHKFPWSDTVATTVAWGVGPSYATEVPKVEETTHSSSQRWLVFWFAEITLGPPESRWAAIFRLHHRSTGFETVAKDGGSNTLAVGLKFLF